MHRLDLSLASQTPRHFRSRDTQRQQDQENRHNQPDQHEAFVLSLRYSHLNSP
jgi:hypothetical protein